MPPSMSIRAGKAYIEVYADNRKLNPSLEQTQKRLRALGKSVDMVGRKMFAAGAIMSAPFVLATKVFSGFDDQMRTVMAVTGASGEQFDMLNEKAKELGRTMSFTASQVAATMVELGRAGFNPQQINDSIEAVMNLARATGTELPLAANIAAGTLRAFNMDASDMVHVADVMTATANKSAQTLEDLGEAMKYAAPVAESYGLTLEETSKILGSLANFSIRGSMAGTTMKQVLLKLADKDVRQNLAQLGVAVTDAGGNLLEASSVLRNLGQALESIPPADRLSMLKDLFGDRAVAGGIKLTTANFQDLNDAIDNAAGTAAKAAAEMDSGIGGAFRRFMSAVEGVAISIGEALAPTLSRLAENLTAVASHVAEWIEKNKGAAVAAAEFAATVTVLGGTLVVVGGALKLVSAALQGYTKASVAATAASGKAKAAMVGLASNPLMLGLAALGAVLGIVTKKLYDADQASMTLIRTMDKALEKSDAQARSDDLRVQRLQQLVDKGELNNKEMEEARRLTGELTDGYGDLGITIDDTTRSVGGLTEAIAALRREQMARELDAVGKALAEARENATKAGQKAIYPAFTRSGKEQAYEDWRSALDRVDELEYRYENLRITMEMAEAEKALADAITIRNRAYDDLNASGTAENRQALADAARAVFEQEERLASLRAEKSGLVDPSPNARGDGDADIANRIRAEDALTEKQKKQVAAWEEKLARQKIDQIDDQYKRELALIDLKYKAELEKAKGNADAIALIEQAKKGELAALEKRVAKEKADAASNLQDQVHRERINQIDNEWTKEHKLIEYEYFRAVLAAKGNKQELDAAKELFDLQMAGLRTRKQKADEAKRMADLAKVDITAQGTFNVRAIQSLQAGDGSDRVIGLLDKIERNTKPIRSATGATFAAG